MAAGRRTALRAGRQAFEEGARRACVRRAVPPQVGHGAAGLSHWLPSGPAAVEDPPELIDERLEILRLEQEPGAAVGR